jgi:hypothetical protein
MPPDPSTSQALSDRRTLQAAVRLQNRVLELAREVDELRAALAELVRLKDGPRDDAYRASKDAAWQAARDALGGGQG